MPRRRSSSGPSPHFNGRNRIRNKQRKLEKFLKGMTKEESKENVIRSCRIGRAKEGFTKEAFKFKKSKIKETNVV